MPANYYGDMDEESMIDYDVEQQESMTSQGEAIDAEYVDQSTLTDEEILSQGTSHPIQMDPPDESFFQKKTGVATDLVTLAQAASSGDAQTILGAVEQFSKSQLVRFLDISVIGPVLLYWAYKGKLSSMERMLMGLIGAGTVIYNGKNYIKNKQVLNNPQLQSIKEELIKSVVEPSTDQPVVESEPVQAAMSGRY